jgi:hypothetical protein
MLLLSTALKSSSTMLADSNYDANSEVVPLKEQNLNRQSANKSASGNSPVYNKSCHLETTDDSSIESTSSMSRQSSSPFSPTSFAEKAAAEMKQIVDRFENCNQEDRFTEVSQNECIPHSSTESTSSMSRESSTPSSPAASVSDLQASVAEKAAAEMEKAAAEMKQIVDRFENCKEEDLFTKVSQNECITDNPYTDTESASTTMSGQAATSFSPATKASNLQVSFAEKTAAEMQEIIHWYENCKQEDRFTKVSQSQCMPENPLVCLDDDVVDHRPSPQNIASKFFDLDGCHSRTTPQESGEFHEQNLDYSDSNTQYMADVITEFERSSSVSDGDVKNPSEGTLSKRKPKKRVRFPKSYQMKLVLWFLMPLLISIIVAWKLSHSSANDLRKA